jgi:hypothetical protein
MARKGSTDREMRSGYNLLVGKAVRRDHVEDLYVYGG